MSRAIKFETDRFFSLSNDRPPGPGEERIRVTVDPNTDKVH